MDIQRKIIHIDMDAFFASVEQLDNPELKGKAVAVGGEGKRGVIAAASYEARKYGVKSAMSGNLARKKCPDLIFVNPRFYRYKEISLKIKKILFDYTDLVEPLSLDEAYLDVTFNKKNVNSATKIAKEIRSRIYSELRLKASAGISINKFLAKIASDINKPNGQKTILPSQVISFLESLPINNFHGIGSARANKMYRLGIFNGYDLKQKSLESLERSFGKQGLYYYNIVRGIDNSHVVPNRLRKSIAAERTFTHNLSSEIFMLERLELIAQELELRIKKCNAKGKTIVLKIKYSDFTQETRSKTVSSFLSSKKQFFPIINELLFKSKLKDSVRLLGITLTNLQKDGKQSSYIQLKFDF